MGLPMRDSDLSAEAQKLIYLLNDYCDMPKPEV